MRQDIIAYLAQITEQEQYNLVKENTFNRDLYAKPGRFIIEHTRLSQLSFEDSHAPLCIITHPRFREFPSHSHDFIELMYVCNGNITHVFGDEKVCLQTDEMILLGKNSTHSILNTEANDIGINLIISVELFESLLFNMRRHSHIRGQALEELLQNDGRPYLKFSAKQSISIRALMETIISMVFCEKNTNGYLLEQALSLLLSQLAFFTDKEETPPSDPRESMKKKLLNYLHTTYTTATLSEAAKMFGWSAPYLSHWICESFGTNFKKLLMEERFSVACELLRTTDLPIKSILERIGYQNHSYFHKQFKNRYGITPDTYRSKHKKHAVLGTASEK